MLGEMQQGMVTLDECEDSKKRLRAMLLGIECLRFGKLNDIEAAKMRDAVFIAVLKDYPFDIIAKAIETWCKTKPVYPSPSEISDLCKDELAFREEQIFRLHKLLENS